MAVQRCRTSLDRLSASHRKAAATAAHLGEACHHCCHMDVVEGSRALPKHLQHTMHTTNVLRTKLYWTSCMAHRGACGGTSHVATHETATTAQHCTKYTAPAHTHTQHNRPTSPDPSCAKSKATHTTVPQYTMPRTVVSISHPPAAHM